MPSRRRVLAAGCLALTGGAGCTAVRDVVETERGEGTETDGTGTETGRTGNDTESGVTDQQTTATDAAEGTTTGDATTGTTTGETGVLRIAATDGDGGEVELATLSDVATVGELRESRTGDGYQIPVTLTDEATEAFADGLERVGAFENPDAREIRTYFEGELLYSARLGHSLADAMETGEWDGSFLLMVTDRETAEKLRESLKDR